VPSPDSATLDFSDEATADLSPEMLTTDDATQAISLHDLQGLRDDLLQSQKSPQVGELRTRGVRPTNAPPMPVPGTRRTSGRITVPPPPGAKALPPQLPPPRPMGTTKLVTIPVRNDLMVACR